MFLFFGEMPFNSIAKHDWFHVAVNDRKSAVKSKVHIQKFRWLASAATGFVKAETFKEFASV